MLHCKYKFGSFGGSFARILQLGCQPPSFRLCLNFLLWIDLYSDKIKKEASTDIQTYVKFVPWFFSFFVLSRHNP